MVDADLLDFVRSSTFRNMERESKRNYSTDMRLLLEFLSSRDVEWRQAKQQDLDDFRDWRCEAQENPERISGTKWDREAAAFTKLFRWGRCIHCRWTYRGGRTGRRTRSARGCRG